MAFKECINILWSISFATVILPTQLQLPGLTLTTKTDDENPLKVVKNFAASMKL